MSATTTPRYPVRWSGRYSDSDSVAPTVAEGRGQRVEGRGQRVEVFLPQLFLWLPVVKFFIIATQGDAPAGRR